MKYLLIITTFLVCNFNFSQIQVESNFNSVHIGRNQSLLVSYNFKRFSIAIGAKYNFNKLVAFPQNAFFKKTIFALTPQEHWGGELNFKFRIFNRKDMFITHLFYNAQFTKSHTRFETYFAIGQLVPEPTSDFDFVYEKFLDHIGPFLVLENNIGLAFEILLTKNLYLSQKFGGGILFFKNLDPNTTIIVGGGNWELTEMLSFGVGYRFDKKEKAHNN